MEPAVGTSLQPAVPPRCGAVGAPVPSRLVLLHRPVLPSLVRRRGADVSQEGSSRMTTVNLSCKRGWMATLDPDPAWRRKAFTQGSAFPQAAPMWASSLDKGLLTRPSPAVLLRISAPRQPSRRSFSLPSFLVYLLTSSHWTHRCIIGNPHSQFTSAIVVRVAAEFSRGVDAFSFTSACNIF